MAGVIGAAVVAAPVIAGSLVPAGAGNDAVDGTGVVPVPVPVPAPAPAPASAPAPIAASASALVPALVPALGIALGLLCRAIGTAPVATTIEISPPVPLGKAATFATAADCPLVAPASASREIAVCTTEELVACSCLSNLIHVAAVPPTCSKDLYVESSACNTRLCRHEHL